MFDFFFRRRKCAATPADGFEPAISTNGDVIIHKRDSCEGLDICSSENFGRVTASGPPPLPPMGYLEIVTRRYENGATHTILSGSLGSGKTTEALAIAYRIRSSNHRADVRVNDDRREDVPKFRTFHESQVAPLLAAGAHLIETKRGPVL